MTESTIKLGRRVLNALLALVLTVGLMPAISVASAQQSFADDDPIVDDEPTANAVWVKSFDEETQTATFEVDATQDWYGVYLALDTVKEDIPDAVQDMSKYKDSEFTISFNNAFDEQAKAQLAYADDSSMTLWFNSPIASGKYEFTVKFNFQEYSTYKLTGVSVALRNDSGDSVMYSSSRHNGGYSIMVKDPSLPIDYTEYKPIISAETTVFPATNSNLTVNASFEKAIPVSSQVKWTVERSDGWSSGYATSTTGNIANVSQDAIKIYAQANDGKGIDYTYSVVASIEIGGITYTSDAFTLYCYAPAVATVTVNAPADLQIGGIVTAEIAVKGDDLASAEGTFSYDTTAFDFVSVEVAEGISNFEYTESTGKWSFYGNIVSTTDGLKVATVTLKAKAMSNFAVISIKDCSAGQSGVAEDAAIEPGPGTSVVIMGAYKAIGDVNNNGSININDAQIAFDMANWVYGGMYDTLLSQLEAAGTTWNATTVKHVADANGDKVLNAFDARAIQVYVHTGEFGE